MTGEEAKTAEEQSAILDEFPDIYNEWMNGWMVDVLVGDDEGSYFGVATRHIEGILEDLGVAEEDIDDPDNLA